MQKSTKELSKAKSVLFETLHHIIFDRWSWNALFHELAASYEAFSTRQPSPLPPLPIPYADFALWQREMLQGEYLAEQLTYWKQQLTITHLYATQAHKL